MFDRDRHEPDVALPAAFIKTAGMACDLLARNRPFGAARGENRHRVIDETCDSD